MRRIISCEFNMDTACVELRLEDGTLLSIDCTAVVCTSGLWQEYLIRLTRKIRQEQHHEDIILTDFLHFSFIFRIAEVVNGPAG